ncbi:MAG: PEP-CTERM sorting domain-containing protein [Nitrospirae bacterium]|nr:PEP-CTERM sorting domain-containing protein [Nitrospirota bacterium]
MRNKLLTTALKKAEEISVGIFVAAILLCGSASKSGAEYQDGFTWDRNGDFLITNDLNFKKDTQGSTVWSYEWFTGTDYLHTSNMAYYWTDPMPGNGRWKRQAMYDNDVNISRWDQNTNFYSGYNANKNSSLIRWTNPVGNDSDIDILGSLRLYWGGQSMSYTGNYWASPVDVQLIMGYFDSSSNSVTVLKNDLLTSPFSADMECGANFGNCPNMVIPIDLSISMDSGDSFFWTAIPQGQVTNKNRWITLNDTQMNISYQPAVVPEPISYVLFITGGAALGFRRFSRQRALKN